jgi:hypothetical protein
MKSKTINLSGIFSLIAGFLRRFHMLLFFLLVSGGLFMAITALISIVTVSSNSAVTSDNTVNGTFDEDTIKRIEQNTTTTPQPGNRPSPFVE